MSPRVTRYISFCYFRFVTTIRLPGFTWTDLKLNQEYSRKAENEKRLCTILTGKLKTKLGGKQSQFCETDDTVICIPHQERFRDSDKSLRIKDPSQELCFDRETRDQPEPGSFFPRSLWGGEMKDPGNEVSVNIGQNIYSVPFWKFCLIGNQN